MDKFEPFQKVLVRDNENQKWRCNFYSHSEIREDGKEFYICPSSYFTYCIPYEGNEYLLGTTDSPTPKHEYKWGEVVEVSNLTEWLEAIFIKKNYDGGNRTILKNGIVFTVSDRDIRPLAEDSDAMPK